jgi:hypothetical protein
MKHSIAILAATAMLGCAPTKTEPVVIVPAPVAAGFNQTWNSVIDILSEQNIPVKTLDKSSGYLMAEVTGVSMTDEEKYADCGNSFLNAMAQQGGGEMISRYNILVRGDSAASTVKVTAAFVSAGASSGSSAKTCTSKGIFEKQFQSDVKVRAESAAHVSK